MDAEILPIDEDTQVIQYVKADSADDQIINGGKNMGFFKDFKDDFSQAVNELMPGEDNLESTDKDDDMVVNTLEDEVDVASELSKLDGLLEQVTKQEPVEVRTPAASGRATENKRRIHAACNGSSTGGEENG